MTLVDGRQASAAISVQVYMRAPAYSWSVDADSSLSLVADYRGWSGSARIPKADPRESLVESVREVLSAVITQIGGNSSSGLTRVALSVIGAWTQITRGLRSRISRG